MNDPAAPSQLKSSRRFGLHGLLAFIAIFIAAVPFGLIVGLLRDKSAWLQRTDLHTETALHDFGEHHHTFVRAMHDITNSGSTLVWLITLTLAGLWLIYRRLYRLAAFVAVAAIGSSLLNEAIKAAVGRTRPVLAHPFATAAGKSFPSGHTQSAIVGYGILLLVFLPAIRRRWRAPLVSAATLMVLLIGLSRIALGVHYLSDVIGGLLIGSAWLLAMTAAFSAWRRDDLKTPVHISQGLEPEHASELKAEGAVKNSRSSRG